jgi:hypothetical protein
LKLKYDKLLCHCFNFAFKFHLCRYKLLPSILAYASGLLLTFVALYLEVGGQGGQPALTYLVPTVLGTTTVLAWMRGDMKEMWTGKEARAYTTSLFSST